MFQIGHLRIPPIESPDIIIWHNYCSNMFCENNGMKKGKPGKDHVL